MIVNLLRPTQFFGLTIIKNGQSQIFKAYDAKSGKFYSNHALLNSFRVQISKKINELRFETRKTKRELILRSLHRF